MIKRLLFLIGLASIFMLIIVGCDASNASTENADGDSKDEKNSNSTDVTLPDSVTITSYDVGSSGHSHLTAISDAFSRAYGTQIRMIPSASGLARVSPLKEGTADIGGRLGDEAYFAFEGIEEFATQQWGPQDIQYIFPILNHLGFLVLEDSEFETIEDLKGAKIPYIIGNPSVNIKIESMLAAVDLTYDDVEVVEVTSYADQPTFMAEGQIDASFINHSASSVYEASELHDIRWLDMSVLHDESAIEKVREVYPFGMASDWGQGAMLSEDNKVTFLGGTSYAPAVYGDADPDLVYNWVKALDEQYDVYSQASAGMTVWKLEEAMPEPLGVPIHEGAVKFFKEKGMWKDEYDEKNQELHERHDQLVEAWETVNSEASEKGLSESEFTEYWLERKEELVD
jgi:hypothetical protein